MALNKSSVSPEQKAAITKAKAILAEAFEAASDKLKASGLERVSGELQVPCNVTNCTCGDFKFGGPLGTCKRDTCRHSLLDHELRI